ncbi:hypothetical protein L7F22_064468 [Adiantum nelumboides]|nr:hypothetical protein [Adiantum nelumboides]
MASVDDMVIEKQIKWKGYLPNVVRTVPSAGGPGGGRGAGVAAGGSRTRRGTGEETAATGEKQRRNRAAAGLLNCGLPDGFVSTNPPRIPPPLSTTDVTLFKQLMENSKFIEFLQSPLLTQSDNGGEYVSTEFQRFCDDNEIKREMTAPYNPSSNGVAERIKGQLAQDIGNSARVAGSQKQRKTSEKPTDLGRVLRRDAAQIHPNRIELRGYRLRTAWIQVRSMMSQGSAKNLRRLQVIPICSIYCP